MGKMVESSKRIEYLCSVFETIESEAITPFLVECILENILPKDEDGHLMVNYLVKEKGRIPAIYYPKYNSIQICMSSLFDWAERNGNDLAEKYVIADIYKLKLYLFMMAIMHEVEHSYQYLIANGKIEAPCKMIQESYKALTELMIPKDYIIPRPVKKVRRMISLVKYRKRENEFLLERNAQFNSLDDLVKIASYNGDEQIASMFINMRDLFGTSGYTNNADGMVINTLRDICMGDKAKKLSHDYEDIDMMERYRLGLPIDQDTRKQILSLGK